MLTTITIPRPHVPTGPQGVPEDQADADYLRAVVAKIDSGYTNVGGSGVTAMIRQLLADAADALTRPSIPELRALADRAEHHGLTGFYVRAIGPDDRWGTYDMAELDRDSLVAFLRSRGEVSTWAVHIVLGMLGHDRKGVE